MRRGRCPAFGKRVLVVCIFAALVIGASCLSLHLLHYSYAKALEERADREFTGEVWDAQLRAYRLKYCLSGEDEPDAFEERATR